MNAIYVIVNESKAIVEAYEDFDMCEDRYIKLVNEDISERGHLSVTIDKRTDAIEHQYFRYDTSHSDGPIHSYIEFDSNYSIYMRQIPLNPKQ